MAVVPNRSKKTLKSRSKPKKEALKRRRARARRKK